MKGHPRVIVAGYFVRFPLGGYVWQVLHYLLGFERLGCETYFYEDSAFYADAYDPQSGDVGPRYDYGVRRLAETFAKFDLGNRWVFWDRARDLYHGLSRSETERVFSTADVFVNVAGVNRLGDRPRPPVRIFVDIDPGVTQINYANHSPHIDDLLAENNLFFTVGENIGTPRCPLPTGGIAWRPTRPPVACDLWESATLPLAAPFTTIGRWDASARDLELRGVRYHWRKSLEWMKFVELPARTRERFEVAMDVDRVAEDARRLRAGAWEIRSPLEVSIDYERYRRYIQESKGEFSAAKGMNIELRTGWFSDRSVCYLAAGRPVVLQDTGFPDVIPTGRGIFAVRDVDDAAEAVRAIAEDYASQSAAARAVARECFDAPKVVAPLVEAAGL
jgi:glycosyltransferase involved in cell wall biosynthesis